MEIAKDTTKTGVSADVSNIVITPHVLNTSIDKNVLPQQTDMDDDPAVAMLNYNYRRALGVLQPPSQKLLIVYLLRRVLGIKLDYQMPNPFSNRKAEIEWKRKTLADAFDLKMKLELGQISYKSLPEDRIDLNPSADVISKDEGDRFDLFAIKQALEREVQFIAFTEQLRDLFGPPCNKIEKCLEIMEDRNQLKLTKLMLLRNPECVNIIRHIGLYLANLKILKLEETEEHKKFNENMKQIYNGGAELYLSFREILEIPRDESLWIAFSDEFGLFDRYTEYLSEEIRRSLNDRSYATLVKAMDSIA